MRILHVSDFHFRRSWFAWLGANAHQYDVCCLTGDLVDLFVERHNGSAWSVEMQRDWVCDWLKKFRGPPLFICSGNHDCFVVKEDGTEAFVGSEFLKDAGRSNRRVAVDGANSLMGGYRFLTTAWGASVRPSYSAEPAVLLSHVPPLDTQIAIPTEGAGTAEMDIADAAKQLPRESLILAGHVHSPACWHDWLYGVACFNPGFATSSSVPNHIIIDTERKNAVFRGEGAVLGPIKLRR